MFDYQVSKHPHFDEACRAFALRHNLVQLAERAGMNVQILRNKLKILVPAVNKGDHKQRRQISFGQRKNDVAKETHWRRAVDPRGFHQFIR